jgi:putative endonuclease
MSRAAPDRRRAEREGRAAETLAALYLRLKFYRILARRFRAATGEIDLIARRGRTLAFVEVKRRGTREAAAASISATARRRIARTAAVFLAQNPHLSACRLRLDAVLIAPSAWPTHLQSAWTETDL